MTSAGDVVAPPRPRRVGILGGSFDPPHVGHVMAALYALLTAPLDAVIVVPVFRHPFAKDLTPFDHRMAMCALAFGDLRNVTVSDVERDLGGESLTLRTVAHLSTAHPEWQLRLILGSDVIPELPKWHRFDRVREIAPPFFIERAGHAGDPDRVRLPEVSSTDVRAALRSGRSVAHDVPDAVIAYVRAHGLYA